MEFFERAHVESSKMKNKSEGAVKKQLKQMLHAYKSGNNQELKSFANKEHSYDFDDKKSMSEISEISFLKEVESSQESVSSQISTELQSNSGDSSNSNDYSSSNSNVTLPESGSLDTISEYEERESRSLQSSQDISATDKDFSSMFESSVLSGEYTDSEISIPSSLQTSSSDSDVYENEEFDADGALANKILEKLGKNVKQSKKRKLVKENTKSPNREKKKQVKESLPIKVTKKESKTLKNPLTGIVTNVCTVIQTKNEPDLTYRNKKDVTSDDSSNSEFKDSLSDKSSPYISVTASDMQSQSLSDIIGDYIHPIVRNLPSVHYKVNKYAISEFMTNDDNVEDISSIIPEIGEDLAIEDLTLEQEPLLEAEQQATDGSAPYDDTVQTEDYFEQESSTEDIEPTPVSIKVYSSKNYYILVMKHQTELFVHGKVKVAAIGGSVEVFGYTLQDETIDLYAPYCNMAHSLKANGVSNAFHGLFSRLSSVGLTASEAEEVIINVTEQDAVVGLSKLNCPKMDFVDNNFNIAELFSKRVDKTPMFLKKAAENLGCSLYIDRPKKVLEEKSSWEQVVACGMCSQSRGIICGGKGTGKSTLLRYYVNRLLASGPVLVIDLDPGQAEFTIPGNVSVQVVSHPLIGPNFTHLRQPEKMLNIGMINPMENISRYISAVTELITYCQSTETFHDLPWIVNTMGMCNQMGLKFITRIILEIQPTFVYQIDSKIAKKRFEFELQSETVKNFYEECMQQKLFRTEKNPYSLDYTFILGVNEAMSQQKGNGFSLLPRDERYLNVLAYFGQLLDIHGTSILEIVPYEVDLCNLSFGANVKIPEQAVMKVINGKIIALCQLAATDKGKMFTLDDKALLCHGYGLIRGIDLEKELLYIITPVHILDLVLVNTLVYADWMPELIGQEKDLPSGTIVPYRTTTVFHERMLMFPPKRRFNPYQLLKATRSA